MTTDLDAIPADATPGRRPKWSMIGPIVFSIQPVLLNMISLPVMAYIIRRLGPAPYGQWATANGLIVVVGAFTTLGLRTQFVRAIARDPEDAPRLTAEQLGLRFVLALASAALAVGFAGLMRYPAVVVRCTVISGAGLVLMSVAMVGTDLLQATRRLSVVAGVAMAQGLALTLASAVAAWRGGGPVWVAAAYLLGPIVTASLYAVAMRDEAFKVGVRLSAGGLWRHLKEARYFAAQQFVGTVGRYAEVLAGPRMLGMNGYGLFSAGTMLPDRLATVPDGLSTALFPLVAASYHRDPGLAARETASYLKLTVALCSPFCVICMFLAGPISRILFPDDPAPGTMVIRITAWALLLQGVDMIMVYALNAAGKERAQTRLFVTINVLSLAASVLLLYRFGLVGGCASYVARHVIAIAFRLPLFLRTFRMPFAEFPLARLVLCNALLATALSWLHPALWALVGPGRDRASLLDWARVLGLLGAEGAIGMGVYTTAALAFKVFGAAEVDVVMLRVRGRFSGRRR